MMLRTLTLLEALDARSARMITFVGAGGKTTAMLRAAEEFCELGVTPLLTTTTHVGDRVAGAGAHIELSHDGTTDASTVVAAALSILNDAASTKRIPLVLTAGRCPDGKFRGPAPEILDALTESRAAAVILVEGDGARGLPIKMPAAHEPVVPSLTGLVVPLVGLDALGRRLTEGEVHRPELFTRTGPRDRVTAETIVELLTSETGGLRNVPDAARVVPLLNKASLAPRGTAAALADRILEHARGRVERVVYGDLESDALSVVRGPRG